MRPASLLRLLCVFGVCLALASAVATRKLDRILQSVDELDSGSLNEREALPLISLLEVETDARVRECELAANPAIFPAAATSFLELPSKDEILAEFRGERPLSFGSHQSHRFRGDGDTPFDAEADPEAVGAPETDPALVGGPVLTDDPSPSPADGADEEGPDSGLKEIPPVSVLVSRYDPNLKRLVPQMPSKLPPPTPVDPRSFYRPLDNPRMGLTCCKGMPCPYANGVCCSNATFCCPHMSECVETRNAQPTCVEIPPQPALKQKITKIEVINKDGTRIASASGDNLNGPGVLTASDIVRAQQAAFEQENRMRLHEQMLKRHQEQAKKIIQATELDQMKADEEVAKLTARKDSAVESIVKMIKTAAENMDVADKKAATINSTVNMGKGSRGNKGGDVDLPAVPSPEQLAEFGMPWPPMAAIINDGLGGIFVRQKGTDWTGKGLIRNGTFNVVTSIEDCKNQCEALPECRVIKFVENTMQCWLDSEMAKTPSACPLVNGQHACVSYVKKIQRWDKNYEYGVTSAKDDDFIVYDQQNRLGQGDPKNGGRLLRNGRRNIVDNLTACIKQCAELKYCVSMVYFRPNGECWLSSAKGEGKAARCARRAGRRDCISYIKKKTNPERGTTGVPIKDNGRTKTVSIENHGDVQSSTFSINLPV